MSEAPKELDTKGGRTSQVLASISEHLKDHANFEKIYKAIAEAGATKHSHSDLEAWSICVPCQKKANDRLLMMRSIGFTSKAMYLTWLRIHQQMDSMARDRLKKYND